jgi:hypothetical protein
LTARADKAASAVPGDADGTVPVDVAGALLDDALLDGAVAVVDDEVGLDASDVDVAPVGRVVATSTVPLWQALTSSRALSAAEASATCLFTDSLQCSVPPPAHEA